MSHANKNLPKPPRWINHLLHWLHPVDSLEETDGDLAELYAYWYAQDGKRKADIRYLLAVLSVLPPFVRRRQSKTVYSPPLALQPDMLRNYLTVAYRNLIRQKAYSFINIAGLATGMAVAMLIGLWIWDELSYNKYHRNYDRIAQVLQNQTFDGEVHTWWSQAMQLAPELRESYGSYFKYVVTAGWPNDHILSAGDKILTKSGNFMEPGIAGMLTLEMQHGTWNGLQEPNSILLSASVARAFFGDADPMGQLMKINHQLNVTVTGVYKDIPANSRYAPLGFIAPFELYAQSEDLENRVGWGNSWFQTIVQIADNADMDQVSAAIKDAKLNKVKDGDDARFKPEILLHPMSRWHLYSDFKNGVNAGGRIDYVWMFGIIGAFVLLLACINFMNLSTARSEKRAKEVGIRKTIGSVRTQLITQFLSESLLIAALAFVLSIGLVLLLLPLFNEITDKQMALAWTNPVFWLLGIGFSGLVGVLAGSYPALYLSSFNPVRVLKGTFRAGRMAAIPRKVLVVVQFTVSVTLIIGTMVVYKQIQFAKNRPIGYNRDGIITIPMKTEEVRKGFTTFRSELLQTGMVSAVAQSESPVTDSWTTNSGLQWKGKDPNMQDELVTVGITHDYGKVVNWQLTEGRDFSTAFATDSAGFILNEEAVKYMGLDNPVGETVKAFGRTYTILGVVKNMVMQSVYAPIRPTLFYIDAFNRVKFISLKLSPKAGASEALGTIESKFRQLYPDTPFEYTFADEAFAAKYQSEERIGKLAFIFAGLAVFISCLGLFGLASFTAEQRTKEIGIRKVLGASVGNIWALLSGDFVRLVMLSCLISAPVAWYFLQGWLENFSYRTAISWWVFAAAGASALLITLLTVSFQAIKAALTNPVKSLRTE